MSRRIFYIVLFTLGSCSKKDNYVKKTAPVNIYSVSIPKSTSPLGSVQIQAFAGESNGCWKDFYFKLIKEKDFYYSLNAYATYESRGACPAVLTGRDTLITFIPDKKGQYIFKTNGAPFKVLTDTLTVN